MNHQKPYFRNNGRYKQGFQAKKPQRIQITPHHGKVVFRLLCPTGFVGGVIGPSGSIIKNIELETSSKILIEDSVVADAAERLVFVLGPEAVEKESSFRNVGDGEIGEVFDVSLGQEALLRVYERILQVERESQLDSDANGGKGVMRCCRLLAVRDQIGPLMGREGKNIDMIRKGSGAYIRVLTPEQLPPCADLADELIQITGDSVAVRKALVLVSKYLQEYQPKEKASAPSVSSSYGASQYPQYPSNVSSFTPFAGNVVNPPPEYSSFKGMNGSSTFVEIVFRILCSSEVVGSVIGKGGSVVRVLQDETGASIHFSPQIAGCNERAITISAMEKVESLQSPAQNAVVRVFARATEALAKSGLVSKWNNGEGVTARLLIPPNQVGCLIGLRGCIVSDLQRSTGTWIQIVDRNQVPGCASKDDKVVQIAGEYLNVKNALVEVTRRLRERIIPSKGQNVEHVRSSTPYSVPDFVPRGRLEEGTTSNFNQTSNLASYTNGTHTLEHKMEDLNLSQGGKVLLSHQHFVCRRGVETSTGNAEHVSEESAATVTNMTVEVPVPENIFSAVFKEDGISLSRLKEISGAKVELQHPRGGNEGKVIISGTPDQTLAGQSLLRAYVVAAK